MATIIGLERYKEQPGVSYTEAATTGSERWILTLDSNAKSCIEVQKLVKSITENNEFDFIIVGETHPDDESLTVINFQITQVDADNFILYYVDSSLTNDTNSINSSVKPSKAQDSYNFSQVEYETIVTVTQSESNAANGAAKDVAIQNTNGVGIIVTESKSILRALITRSESDYDLDQAAAHVGRVNAGSVSLVGSSFGKGQCKLVQWAGSDAYDSEGKLYWRVTYEILISDDDTFFEKEFIMRGVVNKNGKAFPGAIGLSSDIPYKLQEDGTFFSQDDQEDPTKFYAQSFATLESSSWGPALRLSARPNANIITLAGDQGFGLIQ